MAHAPAQPDKPVGVPPAEQRNSWATCPVCRARILKGAKFCNNCKSDLSWKRYITTSNIALGALAALLGVVGTVASKFYPLLTHNDSKLSVSLIGEDSSQPATRVPGTFEVQLEGTPFSVRVTNDGPRPGVVRDSTLELPFVTDKGTEHVELLSIPVKVLGGSVEVPANASQLVKFKFNAVDPRPSQELEMILKGSERDAVSVPKDGTIDTRGKCRMKVSVVSANGRESVLPLTFECSRLPYTILLADVAVKAHLVSATRAPSAGSAGK